MYQTSAYVDLSRATLNDLVEDFLRMQLGFGDKEIAVSTEAGILYDPDETENLPKKLSDLGTSPAGRCHSSTRADFSLGVTADTFVTITDEDDAEPFVNVVLNIQKSYVGFCPSSASIANSHAGRRSNQRNQSRLFLATGRTFQRSPSRHHKLTRPARRKLTESASSTSWRTRALRNR